MPELDGMRTIGRRRRFTQKMEANVLHGELRASGTRGHITAAKGYWRRNDFAALDHGEELERTWRVFAVRIGKHRYDLRLPTPEVFRVER